MPVPGLAVANLIHFYITVAELLDCWTKFAMWLYYFPIIDNIFGFCYFTHYPQWEWVSRFHLLINLQTIFVIVHIYVSLSNTIGFLFFVAVEFYRWHVCICIWNYTNFVCSNRTSQATVIPHYNYQILL